MPLTFAHPALVLPAKYLPERWVSMTGLIVGSVTPDFEYFFRMTAESTYSHTWSGMFWFDLPLSLILCFVYHYIVRDSLICNSPVFLKRRLSRYMAFNWMDYFKHNYFKVIACLLMGIASHIFWDAFTHPQPQFLKIFPFLGESSIVFGLQIPNNSLLHYISSMVGGIIVFYAVMQIPREAKYIPSQYPFLYWSIVIVMVIIAASLNILTVHSLWRYKYIYIFTSAASGLIAGSIIAPLFLGKR